MKKSNTRDDITPVITVQDAHKKTVMEAIHGFCEEMFEDKREVDPASITG